MGKSRLSAIEKKRASDAEIQKKAKARTQQLIHLKNKNKDFIKMALDYNNAVISGKIPACNYHRLACIRTAKDLNRADLELREKEVKTVCSFLEMNPLVEGSKQGGSNFVVRDWQSWVILNVYGLYIKGTDKRKYNEVFLLLGRKNGKTTFAALLALYDVLMGVEGSRSVSVANTLNQSKLAWFQAKQVVDNRWAGRDPEHTFGKDVSTVHNEIRSEHNGIVSTYKAYATNENSADGLNANFTLLDEMHAFRSKFFFDKITGGVGGRENPISFMITTSGDSLNTICYAYYKNIVIKALTKPPIMKYKGWHLDNKDETDLDHVFGAIFTIDKDDDWSDQRTWIKANPSFWDSEPLQLAIMKQYSKAKEDDSELDMFKRDMLNQWSAGRQNYFNPDKLRKAQHNYTMEDFVKKYRSEIEWSMGVDYAQKHDLTSCCAVAKKGEDYYAFTHFFLPKTAVKGENRDIYLSLKDSGHLDIIDCNIVEPERVAEKLEEWSSINGVKVVMTDRFKLQLIRDALEIVGLHAERIIVSLPKLALMTTEIQAIYLDNRLHLDNNETMHWCMSNVILKTDNNKNYMFTKPRANDKIDGLDALSHAMRAFISFEEPIAKRKRPINVAIDNNVSYDTENRKPFGSNWSRISI